MASLQGSFSPVPLSEFDELFTLCLVILQNSIATTQEDLNDFERRLGSPSAEENIKEFLELWDEARQWLSAMELALPWVNARSALQNELDELIEQQEFLEHHLERDDVPHSDQAGFDAAWDELDGQICKKQKEIDQMVCNFPFSSRSPLVLERSEIDRGSRFEAELEPEAGGASGGSGLQLCPDCDGFISCRCLQERLERAEADYAREQRNRRTALAKEGCFCKELVSDAHADYAYECNYCRDQEDRRCKACGSYPEKGCSEKCCGDCGVCTSCSGPECSRCKCFGSDCCCYDSEHESEHVEHEADYCYESSRRYRRDSDYGDY